MAHLRGWLKELKSGDRLFPGLGRKKLSEMIRRDLERAGIPYRTDDGIADFQAAGIEVLAISSDNEEGLQKSIAAYNGGPLPIPLAADSSLDTFKAYRCFDDFEDVPLHGTFFIDAKGRLRWWDIGADPFMDVQCVLDEAKRQMALGE